MNLDELYPGLQVRIIDWDYDHDGRPDHWSPEGDMDDYRGAVVTIGEIDEDEGYIYLHGDDDDYGWQWYDYDFVPYHAIPEDNPNVVYRRYRHEKKIAALRNDMKKRKSSSGLRGFTATGRYRS